MKTFARVLSLALVAVLLCSALIACGKPAKDPKKAVENLKDAGYEASSMEVGGITVVTGASEDGKDYVTITYYENKDDAKKAYDEGKEAFDELKEAAKEADIDLVYGKSGKMVYYGTKAGVKAAG